MNLLAVDTCNDPSAALLFNGEVYVKSELRAAVKAEAIGDLVQALLDDGKAPWSELNGLVVGNGPGSFTGLRLSLGFMKGVSYARRIPLVALSSFHGTASAFALQNESAKGEGIVITDARRGELFMQRFEFGSSQIPKALDQAKIAPIEAAVTVLKNAKYVLTCDSEGKLELDRTIKVELVSGVARGLLEIFRGESLPEFSVSELSKLEPHYLRAVAAKTIEERSRE